MDFEQAINPDTVVSFRQVQDELEKHGCDIIEFLNEIGIASEYKSQAVLYWLGY